MSDTLPGFAAQGWLTLVGPKGLPPEIAQKLNSELQLALARPELQKKFQDLGTYTRQMTLQELSAFVRNELRRDVEALDLAAYAGREIGAGTFNRSRQPTDAVSVISLGRAFPIRAVRACRSGS